MTNSAFDIVERKIKDFTRLTGIDAKWQQSGASGIDVYINLYSKEITTRLQTLLDSFQADADNYCRITPEALEINGQTLSYTIFRYRLDIPFNALSGGVMQKLGDFEEYLFELGVVANTLRDQHYSFMNTAANLAAGVRDADKILSELQIQTAISAKALEKT